ALNSRAVDGHRHGKRFSCLHPALTTLALASFLALIVQGLLSLRAAEQPPKDSPEEMAPADVVKFAGLSPEDSVREMTLLPGFKATLFAGEPDVKQPIAFALDDRGRLWVAEAYTYPRRAPEGQGQD